VEARPGSRRDHDRFCRREGWEVTRNARGRPTGHHITYQLRLPDGRMLRTRISRPADATSYGPSLWAHILSDQLEVSEAEFWACVTDGILPDRGRAGSEPPPTALPAGLVHQLLSIGVPQSEIAGMTREQALARMSAHWSKPTR
jgi:hypothetical protein